MYQGVTATKFGRFHVAELLVEDILHLWRGEPLREADHEPPIPVLDQEDLFSQGIDTSTLVPGAQKVDALGSCTCNAGTANLSERLVSGGKQALLESHGLSLSDAVADEKFAITLYHDVTTQYGNTSTAWPPDDSGSTGLFVSQELIGQGFATGYKSAHGAVNLASLLQTGSVMMGSPFFNAWMEPDSSGFVDGDGSLNALDTAVRSGVAGGHETCVAALEKLTLDAVGKPDLETSHVRVRNSWSAGWGDHGDFRIHLSTLSWLSGHIDYKQLIV